MLTHTRTQILQTSRDSFYFLPPPFSILFLCLGLTKTPIVRRRISIWWEIESRCGRAFSSRYMCVCVCVCVGLFPPQSAGSCGASASVIQHFGRFPASDLPLWFASSVSQVAARSACHLARASEDTFEKSTTFKTENDSGILRNPFKTKPKLCFI